MAKKKAKETAKKIVSGIKKTANKAADKVQTASKNVGTAVKTGAKNVASTTKTAAKTVASTTKQVANKAQTKAKVIAKGTATVAKKVIKGGQEAAAIALFIPFIPIATVFLKRRGVKPSADPRTMILQVKNEMSKKSFGYGGGDSFDYGMTEAGEYGEMDLTTESYGLTDKALLALKLSAPMVIGIIGFLKQIFENIKAKKAKGEKLSADEQAVIDNAAKISEELEKAKAKADELLQNSKEEAEEIVKAGSEAAKNAAEGKDEEKTGFAAIIGNWKIWLAVVILIALYFFLKGKK